MTVTVQDLMNQLAEDESRQLQLQQYFDAAEIWVKNAVTSEEDSLFFKEEKIIPLVDLAIISYAMDLWTHRSETVRQSSAVRHIIGQLRGLYSSWQEGHDENIQTE